MEAASGSRSGLNSDVAYRFGNFEYDPRRRELRKYGIRLRLRRQSLAILLKLLASPGALVTREELRTHIWGDHTFVDFEQALNSAIKRLRDALCDSADHPRYIETVSGQGYRFIAQVECVQMHVPAAMAAASTAIEPSSTTAAVAIAPPPETGPPPSRFRWGIAAMAVLVLPLIVTLGWTRLRPRPPLAQSGWVLIANFDNRTGQPVLDGTLEYALERELSNSHFVKVAPRPRLEDTLRLMKRPLDSRIDRALGREICLRDGDIQALITGRVEKLGTTYVLSAEIVNPANDVTVTSFSEEVQHENELAAAVRRVSGRVRNALGEDPQLVQASLEKLEQVTTPSFRALQLYSRADAAIRTGRDSEAQSLLREALEDDPGFASGHLLLGYSMANLGDDVRAFPEFQQAFQLRNTAGERERLFITASYYNAELDAGMVRKQDLDAQVQMIVQAYEDLLRLYPDDYWGISNLSAMYRELGKPDAAIALAKRMAELRPGDLKQAANALGEMNNDALSAQPDIANLQAAQSYAARVRSLLTPERERALPEETTALRLALAVTEWLSRDIAGVNADLSAALRDYQRGMPNSDRLSHLALTLGRTAEADKLARDSGDAPLLLAASAVYRRDVAQGRTCLRAVQRSNSFGAQDLAAMLDLRLGLVPEARDALRKLQKSSGADPNWQVQAVKGALTVAEGKTDKGIEMLEDSLPHAEGPARFVGWELLAEAYRKQGKHADELRVLQTAVSRRVTPTSLMASYRMQLQLRLADLYREMSQTSQAEQIENDLRQQLQFADADHPIVQALNNRATTAIARVR